MRINTHLRSKRTPKIDIELGVIKPVSSLLINKYLMRYLALFFFVLRLIVV